jgi:hypothetical protein
MWGLPIATSYADVRVQDPSDCVDAEVVDLEVRAALGDAAVDGLDLFVGIVAEGEARSVQIRLSDVRGELLWEKALQGEQRDCPLLSTLVARSVESGISQIPGWRLVAERGRSLNEGGVYAQVTAPTTLRAGVGGGIKVQVLGPLWWGVDVDAYLSGREPVGTGVFQVGALGGTTGPVLRQRFGDEAVDLGVRGWLGMYGVSGRGFDLNYFNLFPRFTINPELTFVSHHLVRLGLRGELQTVRVGLTAPGADTRQLEPAFRVGVTVGVGGPLRSGEARESDRP